MPFPDPPPPAANSTAAAAKAGADIRIHNNPEALSRAAAERVTALCREAGSARGSCHLALAGGSTPRRLYELLAGPPWSQQLPWPALQIYFGDERAVPPEHPDSNYGMARAAWLDRAPLAAGQIHPMLAEPARIAQDAADYAGLLERQLPHNEAGVPVLDLILLGLGPDGHTASLFPGTPVLEERARWVAPVHVEQHDSWRLTLTYPVLEAARQLLFLVAGADKAACIARVLGTPANGELLPVQRIAARGRVEWHLDAAAAGRLAP
ncbi:6-phosphogluconolactonase [Thiohalobacter thiocyanaticus]|uniref:6-phosphogluconolactonase n=1 Tax=Thiohalobacter thiocyanaticus TaxID=585455 RepID=A0A426QKS8_9GAMM|nr:6-phosphogluconolactonase [Thiohalobacter thiocyanaticus]RRQ22326.1 6-phosphogluconolactonase [Thiohalobacter thiocyanaticus]